MDIPQDAVAASAADVLCRLLPDIYPAVLPFVERLFGALQQGHAFILLDKQEAAGLQQCGAMSGGLFVLSGNRLFLGKIWQLEHDLSAEIMRIAQIPCKPMDWLSMSHYLAQWFADEGSRDQKAAAALALLQNWIVISGGPGTGKTTTVAKLLGLLCMNGQRLPRIALAAPTGKAAAHMSRSLHRALEGFDAGEAVRSHLQQLEGQTVHRLLRLKPPYMEPYFHVENPLPLDVLVVDEASMLDTSLLLQLLKALPDGCKTVLLGDENQLPSVGAGAVLSALVQETVLDEATAQELAHLLPHQPFAVSDRPPLLAQNVVRLAVSHRFDEKSGIGCLARAVIEGDAGKALAQFERFSGQISIRTQDIGEQTGALFRLQQDYWAAVARGDIEGAFEHQNDAVVLAARRKDADYFNGAYRVFLQKQGLAPPDGHWFAGQMLMIARNDYGLDLFNGDIGLVLQDTDAANRLAAYFSDGGGWRKIALSRLPECSTAFAMTVHKSQGSEFREVWLLPPCAQPEEENLNRSLLYTAITRAKERFVFMGANATFQAACLSEEKRRSALREMLLDYHKVSDRPV